MSNHKDNLMRVMVLAFALTYLISSLTAWRLFFTLSTFFLVGLVLIALPKARVSNRNVSLALFIIGGIILLLDRSSPREWLFSLGSNSGLVTLFIALPFLSFPLYYENYETAIQRFCQKHIRTITHYSMASSLLTLTLSALLNMGSFIIVIFLLGKGSTHPKAQTVLHRSIQRSNTSAVFWSPNYVAMGVVLTYLPLTWIHLVPLGLVICLLMISVHWISIYLWTVLASPYIKEKTTLPSMRPNNRPAQDATVSTPSDSTPSDSRRLWKLAAIFVFLLLFVAFFNLFTSWHILVIVPVVALLFPILLALVQNKLSVYRNLFHSHYLPGLSKLPNEIVIFAAAGFFGKVLELSGIGKIVPELLPLSIMHQPFWVILSLIVLLALFALVGVHPVVTASAVAATISPTTLGLSVTGYAFALLAAYGLAALISPFSAMSLTLAGITQRNGWELSLRDNFFFFLVMAIILAFVIPLLT